MRTVKTKHDITRHWVIIEFSEVHTTFDPMIDVPEYFSARRAKFLSGFGRKALAQLSRHGEYRQIARVDVEALLGRKLTAQDWDRATIAINRDGLAQREVA